VVEVPVRLRASSTHLTRRFAAEILEQRRNKRVKIELLAIELPEFCTLQLSACHWGHDVKDVY